MKRFLALFLIVVLPVMLLLSTLQPNGPAQAAATTFAVIGDYGMDDGNESAVANLVAGWNPDFIVTTGDDYYSTAGGSGTAKYDESTGAYYCAFLRDISTTGTRCPSGLAAVNRFFPSMGNHDYSDATPAPSTYLEYFTLPGAGFASSSGNERYYDFVQGPVHIFVVNSNTQEPDGASQSSAQGVWLQNQLAASTSPWNIVVFHHPPYSSGSHGSNAYMQWPFAQWGADAVLNGHDHTYERILANGIVYFVNGLGGASRYSFGTPVAGSAVRYNGNWGAQRVTATDTSITFEFLSIDNGGTSRDSYTISNVPTPTPTPDLATTVEFQNGVAPSAGYAGGDDTTISQANASTNYASAVSLLVDGDDPPGTGNDLAALLRWNVGAVPAGSIVQSASITVNVFNASNNTYPLYEMKRAWNEGQATWTGYSAGNTWEAPGGQGTADRGSTVLGTLAPTGAGAYVIALNAAGVALVQGWVDTPQTNQGVIIADSNLADGADFDSSEATTPANRPKLTIRYLQPSATPTSTPTIPPPTATPTPTQSPTPISYLQRVNSGGAAFTDTAGNLWAADMAFSAGSWGYTGGSAKSTNTAVAGTNDDLLYQKRRESPGEYRYTVPNGAYDVTLKFAEFDVSRIGDRKMRITLETTTVETALDIYALVGRATALDRTYQVTVADGVLNIAFGKNGGKKNPVVSAVEVRRQP